MASVTEVTEAEDLVSRMNSIRNVSEAHVAELHEQAQRLGDWREYVRAQPLVALTTAAVVGYVVTSKVTGNGHHRQPCPPAKEPASKRPASKRTATKLSDEDAQEQTVATATTAGLTSGIMAFVGSLASAAFKQYALQKLRGLSEHDRH